MAAPPKPIPTAIMKKIISMAGPHGMFDINKFRILTGLTTAPADNILKRLIRQKLLLRSSVGIYMPTKKLMETIVERDMDPTSVS